MTHKLISIIAASFIFIICIVFFTKKLNAYKNMNFYNIQTIDDLHKLFPKTPGQVKEYAQMCIKIIDEQVKKILAVPDEQRNFDNTARELDNISLYVHPILSAISSLEYLSPNKELREAAQEQKTIVSDYMVDHVAGNVELYKAFKAYALRESESLTEEQEYFIQHTLDDFIKSGLELPKEKLEQVKKLAKELHVLETQFQINIAAHQCKIFVTKEKLDGVPENFISALKTEGDKYILGCDYPAYFAVMNNCSVESTRKKMYFEFANRAYPKNIELLNQIIAKRDEMAKLLGFDSFASLNIEDQMAKDTKTVEEFLNNIAGKAHKKASQEITMFLRDLPGSITLENGQIKPWDFRYIKEMYRQKNLNLDDSKIAEYFPMENTLDQLFDIYQTFFSLRFEKVKITGFWSPDLQLIKIYKKTGEFLGYLFLDLFPRDNKYTHAANMTVVSATTKYPAVCIMIANFPKETKEKPALLTYQDVVTFFHEFGHGLHAMLGSTDIVSFSGTNVKTDFVEMPSQMLENWLKDEEILKKVSSHYKTHEPLPDNIIKGLVDLEKLDSGDQILKQCYYAFLALKLYGAGANKDVHQISKELFQKLVKHVQWQENDHTEAAFGHLMGYGARYYGYLWADVFASDLFEQIKNEGLLNPEVGQKYAQNILVPGGSKDPNILLKNFLGRGPNQEAYLKSLGFE